MQTSDDSPVEVILEGMDVAALILEERGVVLHASSAAGRLLASPAEALVGRSCTVPVPAQNEAEHVLPSGTTLRLRATPIIWRGIRACLLGMQAVGERGGADRRSCSESGLYRLLLRNLPDGGIFVFDHDLRYVLAEGTTLGNHGFEHTDFEGVAVEDIVGKEVAQTLLPLYARAIAGEEGEIELPYEGHVYRMRSVPIRDEQGRVVLGMALSQDITRLKHIEREVRSLNEQLQELLAREQRSRADAEGQRMLLKGVLDQAPAMMCILHGPELVYQYVNDIYCMSLGRTREELMGRRIRDVFPELVEVGLYKLLDDVYRTGQPFRAGETPVPVDLNQDGTIQDMYFSFSYQPVRDVDGEVSGIVVHAINLTDEVLARRAIEQTSVEVARLNRELERRVQELAAANRELEAFAHSVSHDLRAPLRGIDGFGQALLEDYADCLDGEGRRYLTRIRAAAAHMGELIDDLLALSRVSRLELQSRVVALSEMADEILARLREQEPARQVQVRISPALSVRGDGRLLRIALENLLENAWKFTSKKPTATIELGALEEEGERVFFVRDDGAGFDPAYRHKLFGTFNRLHSPVDFPGVGIGLVTVKRVIERHGGRIWADGGVDQGATFYFTLPQDE